MFDLFGGYSRDEARGLVLRGLLVLGGLVSLAGALGFLFGWPMVTRIWPFLAYGLTPVFLASILAAIAAPLIWIGLSGEFAALRGGAANLLVSGLGIGVFALSQSWGDPAGRVLMFGAIQMAVVLISALLIALCWRIEWVDDRPTPVLVRVAFVVFGLALIVAGTALVLGQDIFPWPLDRETSTVYGLIFMGNAVYFAYGLQRPVWGNAKGQLVAFLAYDLVLIIPFARLWPAVPSLSLALYLAVIIGSAALAIWYLAISSTYRLWAQG